MSQVTENKVISAPVPMTPLQEFWHYFKPVSYTHLTLPTTLALCRSRWSPYH